jgi:hypothetical protein
MLKLKQRLFKEIYSIIISRETLKHYETHCRLSAVFCFKFSELQNFICN